MFVDSLRFQFSHKNMKIKPPPAKSYPRLPQKGGQFTTPRIKPPFRGRSLVPGIRLSHRSSRGLSRGQRFYVGLAPGIGGQLEQKSRKSHKSPKPAGSFWWHDKNQGHTTCCCTCCRIDLSFAASSALWV